MSENNKRRLTAILAGSSFASLPFLLKPLFFLWWPGLMLAAVPYPGGIHDGGNYIPAAILVNYLIYIALFNLTLRLLGLGKNTRNRGQTANWNN